MAKPNIAHLRRLIGNPNVLAEQQKDGTYRPWLVRHEGDAKHSLDKLLRSHLEGRRTFGTYIINPPDKARTLVFDIDNEGDIEARKAALRQAWEIGSALRAFGIPLRSIGTEWSGKKGYHVWVPVWDYVPAATLRHLGQAVLLESGVSCEVFPKQDHVPEGGLGNLVKLPGGVHRVTGKPNDYVTAVPQPLSLVVLERIMTKLPPLPEPRRNGGEVVTLECMANIQAGVGEGARNFALFQFCAHARRASLGEEFILGMALDVNQRFDPPLDHDEVAKIVEHSKDRGPICRQLPDDIRCADCPIYRERGLYTKPGQIKNGGEGELAVVEIGRKEKGAVDIKHPDFTAAKGYVR